jgi:hypothetical protein
MLSRSISTSRKVTVELKARLKNVRSKLEFVQLLYTWILPHADDFGRMEGDAATVKGTVMPNSTRDIDDVEWALQALHDVGLLLRYQIDGRMYLQVVAWEEHQSGLHKRTRSRFPEVPGDSGKFPRNGTERNRTELPESGVIHASLEARRARAREGDAGAARARHEDWADRIRRTGVSAEDVAAHRPNLMALAQAVAVGDLPEGLVETAITDTAADAKAQAPTGKRFVRNWFAYFTGQVKRQCRRRGIDWPLKPEPEKASAG